MCACYVTTWMTISTLQCSSGISMWSSYCTLQAKCEDKYVGAIVCKMDNYNDQSGYIAMLAVDKAYRKRKIGI